MTVTHHLSTIGIPMQKLQCIESNAWIELGSHSTWNVGVMHSLWCDSYRYLAVDNKVANTEVQITSLDRAEEYVVPKKIWSNAYSAHSLGSGHTDRTASISVTRPLVEPQVTKS